MAPRSFLDIELKVRGLEPRLLAALRKYPPLRDYLVSSFLPEVVLELKAASGQSCLSHYLWKPSQLMAWRNLPVEFVIGAPQPGDA